MVKLAIATKHSSKLSSLWFNHLTPFSHTFIYKPNFEAGHLQCDKQRSEWSAHLLACLLVCYAARQGPAHDGVRLARPNMLDTKSELHTDATGRTTLPDRLSSGATNSRLRRACRRRWRGGWSRSRRRPWSLFDGFGWGSRGQGPV